MIELKGELDKFPVIGRNFNTSLPTVVRTTGQKIRKDMEELKIFHM